MLVQITITGAAAAATAKAQQLSAVFTIISKVQWGPLIGESVHIYAILMTLPADFYGPIVAIRSKFLQPYAEKP